MPSMADIIVFAKYLHSCSNGLIMGCLFVYLSVCPGKVGKDVTVTNRCVVGAGCEVLSKETLSEDTIIFGANCRRYHKKVALQVKFLLRENFSAYFFYFADYRPAAIGVSYQSLT